jgi:uncharacterized damage-inducible protein DinB
MDIKNLIRYNLAVRASYLEALAKLPWSEVTTDRKLSWDSIRNVFVHLTLVEDRWINYAIPGRIKDWVDPDFNAFTSVGEVEKYMRQVHAATEVYLAAYTEAENSRLIIVPWGEKPYSHLPVEAVLTHMVMECMVHYGELSAAMWQLGVEPPYKAYWRYAAQTRTC